MHLSDRELGAALESRGSASEHVREHLARCGACRETLDQLRAAEREVGDLLHLLDHPAPPTHFSTIVARASSPVAERSDDSFTTRELEITPRLRNRVITRDRHPWRWGAIILAVGATAAAAAVPSSPVRRLISAVVAPPAHVRPAAPVVAAPPQPLPPPASPRGIAIVPRREVTVVFTATPALGAIHIRSVDADSATRVAVLASGDGARYAVSRDTIEIDNRGAPGLNFDVALPAPSAVSAVTVRVGDRVVFARRGDRVDTRARRIGKDWVWSGE